MLYRLAIILETAQTPFAFAQVTVHRRKPNHTTCAVAFRKHNTDLWWMAEVHHGVRLWAYHTRRNSRVLMLPHNT